MPLHARTPVVVGVGQIANKDPERIVHPTELMCEAVRAAAADAHADVLLSLIHISEPTRPY